jgi:hypothetical protein
MQTLKKSGYNMQRIEQGRRITLDAAELTAIEKELAELRAFKESNTIVFEVVRPERGFGYVRDRFRPIETITRPVSNITSGSAFAGEINERITKHFNDQREQIIKLIIEGNNILDVKQATLAEERKQIDVYCEQFWGHVRKFNEWISRSWFLRKWKYTEV